MAFPVVRFRPVHLATAVALALCSGPADAIMASDRVGPLGLPPGELRTANAFGLGWTPVEGLQQPHCLMGEAILVLPNAIVATGRSSQTTSTPTVAIWERVPADAIAPWLGWRHADTLGPITDVPPTVGPALEFGAAIAGDDRWLFVGAPATKVDGVNVAGAVHAYRRDSEGVWQPYAVLVNPQPGEPGRFGAALAFDDGVLVVGVPWRFAVGTDDPVGGADRFVVTDDSIGPPLSLVSPLGGNWHADLGTSVAIEGSRFALGHADAVIPGIPTKGVVAVFSVQSPDDPNPVLDAVLASPTSQTSTRFGVSIAFDEGRLAVGAPLEDRGGKVDCGVVRIYEREKEGWRPTHELVGPDEASMYGLSVDLDGDFLAVGGGGPVAPGNESGRAVLAEIVGGSIVSRAEAGGGWLDPIGWRDDVGRTVALGHGTWTFAETHRYYVSGPMSETAAGMVRFLPVAAATTDCDGDGVSDLADVLAGALDRDGNGIPDDCANQADCDGNGEPDPIEVLWAADLGAPTADSRWYGYFTVPESRPATLAHVYISPKIVPSGSDGVLRGVAFDALTLRGRAQPLLVAIYDDPDQDGDPADATLRIARWAATSSGMDIERVLFEEQWIGEPGTTYFVGMGSVRYQNAKSAAMIRTKPLPSGQFDTWIFAGADGLLSDLDLESPSKNSYYEGLGQSDTLDCEGLFAGAADLDVDGVPDACACAADLDEDGLVGPSDLAGLLGAWGTPDADLDGDGQTGAGDLAVLLGSWGDC